MSELLMEIQSCKRCSGPFGQITSHFNDKVKNIQIDLNTKVTELNKTINSQLNELMEQLLSDLKIDSIDRMTTKSILPLADKTVAIDQELVDVKQEPQHNAVQDIPESPTNFSNNDQSSDTDTDNEPLSNYIPVAKVTDAEIKIKISTKPSKCQECDLVLSTGRHLISHMVNVHGHEKPVPCDICNKRFMDRSNMRQHLRSHQRPKKEGFVCDICPMVIRGQHAFLCHRRTHTGEDWYECDVCKKGFAQKTALTSHMRLHSGERPYMCHLCCKTFRHQPGLRSHERVHTGERPYKCSMCDRTFRSKNTLDVHVLAHTGERPYKCPICKKGYTKRYLVRNHIKNCHGVSDAESVYPRLRRPNNRTVYD